MSASLKDLFHRFSTPPTPTHAEVQRRAREAGWTPPWDREEQQSQKKAAGRNSALVRGGRGEIRLSIIEAAYVRLSPTHKNQPYSEDSIDALREGYLSLLGKGPPQSSVPPTKDELDLFASAVSDIAELPEADRIDALQEEYYSIQSKGGAPRSSILLTEDELDLLILAVLTIPKLSETDKQALQKVSRETLRKGLMQLGVKSTRRIKRSG